uniref:Prostaglandin E synthase 2 n=1 Tax=Picea sitchensis TaxID=3332 RepID=A9P0L0_PICSI|nr:unknown [Picea sitchensis]
MRVQGLGSVLRKTTSRSGIFASRVQNGLADSSLSSSPWKYRMLSSLPSTSFNDGGKRDDEKWARKGPFMAAGAISFSFAASSFTTAVAKERPSSEFIPKDLVLYQYEACPFCNKVKAFLDYHDLTYKIVEVNPLGKKEIKWSDYKKVPILMVDGKQLNDSSAIIDKLDSQIHPNKGRLPTDAEEEEKWRRWVDEHLVHILSPNIYRSASEALESFDYITTHGNFSTLERLTGKYVGAAAMYFVSKKLKKKHNITDERASLYEAANAWVEALNNRLFMGGSKPNLADLAVFGVLRPIRYLQSGRDMVANTNIGAWYSRMEDAVGGTSGIKD